MIPFIDIIIADYSNVRDSNLVFTWSLHFSNSSRVFDNASSWACILFSLSWQHIVKSFLNVVLGFVPVFRLLSFLCISVHMYAYCGVKYGSAMAYIKCVRKRFKKTKTILVFKNFSYFIYTRSNGSHGIRIWIKRCSTSYRSRLFATYLSEENIYRFFEALLRIDWQCHNLLRQQVHVLWWHLVEDSHQLFLGFL